jgi:hypothetical protein
MNFAAHPLKRSTMRGDVASNPIQNTVTGNEATFVFSKPGFFGFYCDLHGSSDNGSNMAGVVWVADGAGPPPVGFGVPQVLPSSHDFGPIAVGAMSDPFTFSVVNTGTAPIGGLAVSINGVNFVGTINNKCAGVVTLAPGSACTMEVQFKPASRGLKNGSVIASGSGQTVSASLSGTGQTPAQLAVSPASVNLAGKVGMEGTPVTITVANVGDVATGVVSVALGGSDASSFKMITNGCLAPLPSGGSCQVSVAVAATPTAGARVATLTASSPTGGMAIVMLTASVTN